MHADVKIKCRLPLRKIPSFPHVYHPLPSLGYFVFNFARPSKPLAAAIAWVTSSPWAINMQPGENPLTPGQPSRLTEVALFSLMEKASVENLLVNASLHSGFSLER